jgi:hypothetical protein
LQQRSGGRDTCGLHYCAPFLPSHRLRQQPRLPRITRKATMPSSAPRAVSSRRQDLPMTATAIRRPPTATTAMQASTTSKASSFSTVMEPARQAARSSASLRPAGFPHHPESRNYRGNLRLFVHPHRHHKQHLHLYPDARKLSGCHHLRTRCRPAVHIRQGRPQLPDIERPQADHQRQRDALHRERYLFATFPKDRPTQLLLLDQRISPRMMPLASKRADRQAVRNPPTEG